MRDFDYHFTKMTNGIEDHEFKGWNHSLGCYIQDRNHYKHEMKKRGCVPDSMAEEMRADWHKRNPGKEYKTSRRCHELINFMQERSKNGMITLGQYPRLVKEMESMGMSFDMGKLEEMGITP